MFDFNAYMKDIAERLIYIQHTDDLPRFHRVSGIASLEELMVNLGHTTGYQLMIEDNYNGRFSDNASQNWLNYRQYSFYILKQSNASDPDDMETIKAGCFTVVKKAISKIKMDRLSDHRAITNFGLRNLDTENIRYMSIGPLGDHYYGIQVYFTLVDPAGMIYDTDDWTPES